MSAQAISHPVDKAIFTAQCAVMDWHRVHADVLTKFKGNTQTETILLMAAEITNLRLQINEIKK